MAVLLLRRQRLPAAGSDWKLISITGVLTFTLNYGLIFWGENYISSGLTAILFTTLPLFGLVIAHFHLPSEPITLRKVFGVLLGILGVATIFSNQLHVDTANAVWGCLAVVSAASLGAYAGVLIKAHGKHLDPFTLTTGQMLVGFGPLLVIGYLLEGNPSAHSWTGEAWLALFYLAFVGSSLTFVLLYWLIKRIDITKTQLIPLASTLVAVLLGRVVLNEELDWRTGLGGAGILAGLVMSTWKERSGQSAAQLPTSGTDAE